MNTQFSLKNDRMALTDKAIAYANANNLHINYINMSLPGGYSVTTGSQKINDRVDLGSNIAVVTYYQCESINPNHTLSVQKGANIAILTG